MGLRLDDFYQMSFAELVISFHGWNDKRDRQILDNQFIAYHAMIGSHLDPKKIPSFKKFIGEKETIKLASEESKKAFLNEYEEYLKKKKAKDNELQCRDIS